MQLPPGRWPGGAEWVLALVGALRASGRVLYWALRETCYQLAKGKAEVRGGGSPLCT